MEQTEFPFKKWTEDVFKQSIAEHKDKYCRRMLIDFWNKWSESDGKKMLFQKENTWETSKRLARWRSNNYGNYHIDEQQINQNRTNNPTGFATNSGRNSTDKRGTANSKSREIFGI